ncbi:MAG: glycosyltransferase [Peptococcaceae bacterium]|jgi:glycosyltransferase involved in cell wall biosynthesis|nr:glycosyltransferase [Peptococcaceae bacterium]
MVTISLCMIVKNEEAVLKRLLSGVTDLVDEIIIVDTGSTDRTKEIAREFTPHVYDFPWQEDFAAARNYAFSHGTKDYLLWLDADDVILPKAKEKFLQLKKTLSPMVDVVMLPYETAFDEQGNPTFSYFRERLIKNHAGFRWEGEIHEVITPRGNIIYGNAPITHQKIKVADPERNLRIFEKMLAEGKTLSPRHQFYYGRELFYHGQEEKAATIFEEFLANPNGWSENKIECTRQLAACYFHQGLEELGITTLFRSFLWDKPRAEICCDIGAYFLGKQSYEQSIFWYTLAADTSRDDTKGGFILGDCYGLIPYLQLCVCYDRLGDREKALHYHQLVGKINPNHPSYLQNEQYFQNKKETP